MKQLTELTRINGYLSRVFDLLNQRYFENALSKPVITIQNTPSCYGHVSVKDVWYDNERSRKELNIGAGTLNRPIENVVSTMLHEMVHLYCADHDIKDTSRSHTYHNKNFKVEAEKRDLSISYSPTIGYSITTPTTGILQFCLDNGLDDIRLFRSDSYFSRPTYGTTSPTVTPPIDTPVEPPKKPSSTRKYQCPCCKASFRATRDIEVLCIPCAVPFQKV